MGHVGVWAGEPGNWGGGVCAGKLAHPSHKCHPLRETQEYFIVSLKTEPPVQLFRNSRGQDRCGEVGRGPACQASEILLLGLGGNRMQFQGSNLSCPTHQGAGSTKGHQDTRAMCFFPHQPSKWLLSQLWQSVFK